MRAHQIMTRSVVTVTPESSILDAANLMLQRQVSELPVVDAGGKLVGVRRRFHSPQRNRYPSRSQSLNQSLRSVLLPERFRHFLKPTDQLPLCAILIR